MFHVSTANKIINDEITPGFLQDKSITIKATFVNKQDAQDYCNSQNIKELKMPQKELQDLHLTFSTITHQPRIAKYKASTNKQICSDKYIDIPIDEFRNAIAQYFAYFKDQQSEFVLSQDWSFYFGGNAKTKKQLLDMLEELKQNIEKMPTLH